MRPDKRLDHFLDQNGDGTGIFDAKIDHSATPVDYFISPPAGRIYAISRLLTCIKDSGSLDADGYGNGASLTNGIIVSSKTPSGELIARHDGGQTIKTNAQWGRLCYDVKEHVWGLGDEILLVRWTFTKAGGPLIYDEGERFCVTINDDHTNLTSHTFLVQGEIIK